MVALQVGRTKIAEALLEHPAIDINIRNKVSFWWTDVFTDLNDCCASSYCVPYTPFPSLSVLGRPIGDHECHSLRPHGARPSHDGDAQRRPVHQIQALRRACRGTELEPELSRFAHEASLL